MNPAPIRIAVAGAEGRMGRVVCALVAEEPRAALVARFDRHGGEGLVARDDALAAAEVVIDFTVGDASAELATLCAERGGPALVIGSTGFDAADLAALEAAAARIAILRAGNFSLGVNLLAGLVRQAARALPADWDIEIVEAHHRRKVDAPSGTALLLGVAAAQGRGVPLADVTAAPRDGIGDPRSPGEIGFAVVRGGGIVGEHSVLFAAEDEILTLSHSARDRRLFAKGAAAAALWLAGKPPGAYGMDDVLGLGSSR